jgi:hypothetical protein
MTKRACNRTNSLMTDDDYDDDDRVLKKKSSPFNLAITNINKKKYFIVKPCVKHGWRTRYVKTRGMKRR